MPRGRCSRAKRSCSGTGQGSSSRRSVIRRSTRSYRAMRAQRAFTYAFTYVSVERVSGYLAEFPGVQEHLSRFRGQVTATFTREVLDALMAGLEPAELAMFDR